MRLTARPAESGLPQRKGTDFIAKKIVSKERTICRISTSHNNAVYGSEDLQGRGMNRNK
ncbi:hypothetical protein ANABIO32_26640 [Rossellomorea marisflavi]|nr:hypothetical protein ANABIO32_26640 [Rossellomorea marisflavi]